MTSSRYVTRRPDRTDVDDALAQMSADQLREIIRAALPELDRRAYERVANSVIDCAARGGSGWVPAAVSGDDVSAIVAFIGAARRLGRADPSEIDEYLRRGSGAFLRRDYACAARILGAILRPIAEGAVDLGQHEMIDEVLGVDVGACAAQYVVAEYMTVTKEERPRAVRSAIEQIECVGYFSEPLREMESVAVEPLPDLAQFLTRWRELIEVETGGERSGGQSCEQDRWLREVVRRTEGAEGLARLARSTRRAEELRAWCRILSDAGDWTPALHACEEAAEFVADGADVRAEFLDGSALAAQQLGRADLPVRLEQAWRASPTMLRLRRWLGAVGAQATVARWAAEALESCPKEACRQRAFLHVLLGDLKSATELLGSAPGLGWSDSEHPGPLLFPLFAALLGGERDARSRPRVGSRTDREEIEPSILQPEGPVLAAPEIDQILARADSGVPVNDEMREALIASMRQAAERRVEGVTGQRRRQHYEHAASLVAICASVDQSPATVQWVTRVRTEHRRYPALWAAFDRQLHGGRGPNHASR